MTRNPPMLKLLGLYGSLSKTSINRAVLNTLRERCPPGAALAIYDISGVPLYDPDLDGDDPPAAVIALKAAIATSDALVISTPEYNFSIPGVLKNALDWASRPAFRSVLAGKPAFILSASPGAAGGVRAQMHLRTILASTLSETVPHRPVAIGGEGAVLENGRIADPASLARLDGLVRDIEAYFERTQKATNDDV